MQFKTFLSSGALWFIGALFVAAVLFRALGQDTRGLALICIVLWGGVGIASLGLIAEAARQRSWYFGLPWTLMMIVLAILFGPFASEQLSFE